MALLPVLSLGFVLGMTHATDADHVVAVSTIVSERRRLSAAAWVGTLWGLGHTLTVLVFGGAIVLFRLAIPPELGLSLELGVAVMLLALGVRSLPRRGRAPTGEHHHATTRERSSLRSVGVGLVHGLAGSAAVALGVLTQVESPGLGVAYLGVFGLGTVAGMMLITSLMAVPLVLATRALERAHGTIRVLAGLGSIALGLFLVYEIGFVDGLFTGSASWSPH